MYVIYKMLDWTLCWLEVCAKKMELVPLVTLSHCYILSHVHSSFSIVLWLTVLWPNLHCSMRVQCKCCSWLIQILNVQAHGRNVLLSLLPRTCAFITIYPDIGRDTSEFMQRHCTHSGFKEGEGGLISMSALLLLQSPTTNDLSYSKNIARISFAMILDIRNIVHSSSAIYVITVLAAAMNMDLLSCSWLWIQCGCNINHFNIIYDLLFTVATVVYTYGILGNGVYHIHKRLGQLVWWLGCHDIGLHSSYWDFTTVSTLSRRKKGALPSSCQTDWPLSLTSF